MIDFLLNSSPRFITALLSPGENELYPDLVPVRELVIQGVMVALLRQGEGKVA